MSRTRRGALVARRAGRSAYAVAVNIVLTGIVVIVPLVVTLYVLTAALGFIASALNPVIKVLRWAGLMSGVQRNFVVEFLVTVGVYRSAVEFITEITALVVLVVLILAIGTAAHFRYGEQVIDFFDRSVSRLPGVGSVYKSFRRMGDVMLESEVDNFRDVKLVEFPHDDVYVLGFETNRSPLSVQAAANVDGMTTLFLPLAPNPVMGGFLAHIPDERVQNVDMSVETAVSVIITSGIATEDPAGREFRDLADEEKRGIATD